MSDIRLLEVLFHNDQVNLNQVFILFFIPTPPKFSFLSLSILSLCLTPAETYSQMKGD